MSKSKTKPRSHKHPEYSEYGPIWTVYPVERSEELGTHTNFLVADLDFDSKNLTGHFIAECGDWENAVAVADALNAATRARPLIDTMKEWMDAGSEKIYFGTQISDSEDIKSAVSAIATIFTP